MNSQRRRCWICSKMSSVWKKMPGGSAYCADGCHSTTGFDRRTLDGRALTPPGYWDFELSAAEESAQLDLQKRLATQLSEQTVDESQPHPGEKTIAEMMQCKYARQCIEALVFRSSSSQSTAVLTLLARMKPFDLHWQARMVYLLRTVTWRPELQEMSLILAQAWRVTPRLNWNL